MTTRELKQIITSVPTSDGAGVKLRRSLGSRQSLRHDPFLMLDEFFSDDPADYLAGFPEHPHRGFETVTYMLDGYMQRRSVFAGCSPRPQRPFRSAVAAGTQCLCLSL
jgi:redox-sensitive bicupin YhaK (pirin superfamily)